MASSSAVNHTPVGQRMLTSIIADVCHTAPDSPLAVYATSPDLKQWRHVSYRDFERAVDSIAWWIKDSAGTSTTFETVSYIGLSDIRYMIFWMAAMKCGYCTLNPSPRNATAEQLYLLSETKCTKVFFSKEMKHKMDEIKGSMGSLQLFQIADVKEVLSMDRGVFNYDGVYSELSEKPAMIFHTSGSTGMPKPITLKHSYFAASDNLTNLPTPEGRRPGNWKVLTPGRYVYSGFPLFHLAGAVLNFMAHLFQGTVTVIHPPWRPLDDMTFVEVASAFDLQGMWTPPSFMEELAASPRALEKLASVEFVFSGSGPTPQLAGDAINKVTTVVQLIGNTEMATIPTLIQPDWQSFEFNPIYGIEMEATEQEGVYEAVLHRNPEMADYHAIFRNFPELDFWHTKDLFKRTHPDSDKLWRFVGRTDDVIVLSTGEKFNPLVMQMHIHSSPLAKGALVVGQGRFQVALLVEPEEGAFHPDRPDEFIDALWPTVQEANSLSTATGMVFKNMILVASPGKPFIRAPKGTIIRGRTIAAYTEEINVLYQGADETGAPVLPDQINEQMMEGLVEECLQIYMRDEDILNVNAEFSTYGVDSLQTLGLAKTLSAAIKLKASSTSIQTISSSDIITPKTIYQHPTIKKLSQHLVSLLTSSPPAADTRTRQRKLLDLVDSYAISNKSGATMNGFRPQQEKHCVILSGTTRSLGLYLLHELILDNRVMQVYCFNRTADAYNRTLKSLQDKGLSLDLTKVEFLHTTIGSERFGLSPDKYNELLRQVDIVIHNAWAVNFHYPIESFATHIKGVAQLASFCTESAHNAHLYFISSVGTVSSRWEEGQRGPATETVPEQINHNFAPVAQGYAESKFVSEQILSRAAEEAGVDVTVVRVGQVAGPTTAAGQWNETDWLPRILAASKLVGKIPAQGLFGDDIDWVPVDKGARICTELLFARLVRTRKQPKVGVYHLNNPRPVHWSEIVPAIQSYFQEEKGIAVEAVPLSAWVDAVRRYGETHGSTPVSALLDATGHISDRHPLELTKTVADSKTMEGLEAVSPALMKNWMRQWDM